MQLHRRDELSSCPIILGIFRYFAAASAEECALIFRFVFVAAIWLGLSLMLCFGVFCAFKQCSQVCCTTTSNRLFYLQLDTLHLITSEISHGQFISLASRRPFHFIDLRTAYTRETILYVQYDFWLHHFVGNWTVFETVLCYVLQKWGRR